MCLLLYIATKQTFWINLIISVKVIPGFCIAHSYCARFLRHQRARGQNIRHFPQTKLVSEIKSSFSLKQAR